MKSVRRRVKHIPVDLICGCVNKGVITVTRKAFYQLSPGLDVQGMLGDVVFATAWNKINARVNS